MPESGNYNYQPHLKFFGLSYNPFPAAPDNTDFYLSLHNEKIIKELTEAIFSRKGFMILTGEIGLGKTTTIRRIIQILEENNIETSLILQSFFQGENLLKEIIRDFNLEIKDSDDDLSLLMTRLNNFLLEKNKKGINCTILIDDAQNLTVESLELVRMISNFETGKEKLVQIVLVGQPELMIKLDCHELRQLKSRITSAQKPIPLKQDELSKYIQFKLNLAGNSGKLIIEDSAIKKLYKFTKGNFRKINTIMDRTLYFAFNDKTHIIKPEYIKQANKELTFDIPQQKTTSTLHFILICFLILIITGMISGACIFYFVSDPKSHDTTQPDIIVKKNIPEIQIPVVPNPIDSVTSIDSVDPIKQFLLSYNLEGFISEFQKSLNQDNFNYLQSHILQKFDLQLIKLKTVSKAIREKYDILSNKNQKTGKSEFFLFWRPTLKINKFYSGYKGEKITALQKLLTDSNMYSYNIDGIVGKIMTTSLIKFQKLHNLPITGFPDPTTIFLLIHQNTTTQKQIIPIYTLTPGFTFTTDNTTEVNK